MTNHLLWNRNNNRYLCTQNDLIMTRTERKLRHLVEELERMRYYAHKEADWYEKREKYLHGNSYRGEAIALTKAIQMLNEFIEGTNIT